MIGAPILADRGAARLKGAARPTSVALACILATVVWSACGGEPRDATARAPTDNAAATDSAPATNDPPAVADPPATDSGSATAAAAAVADPPATAAPLSAAEIFERVAPAVAFAETPTSTGSALLIEGGYLVTNAHVVWPYATARVVFPDGSDFGDVPVVGWDLLVDIAVLGPIDAAAAPLALADGEGLPIGSDVFLIGYPGEVEALPQPTIAGGLLSRTREWETAGITYLQTDAVAASGQSGGALVSRMGEVIGLSGFRFSEVAFGLVASAADILPRVRALIDGRDPVGLGRRQVPLDGGAVRHEVVLENLWDEIIYVINEPPGTEIDIEFSGANDGALMILDAFGARLLEIDTGYSGAEAASLTVEGAGPLFLRALQLDETSGAFVLKSSHALRRMHDPEDGREIAVGQTIVGNVDAPGDLDYFTIALREGETIEIRASAILIDTLVAVDFVGAAEIDSDDDSGGGLFGLDAKLIYRAPHTGSYFVSVRDASLAGPGAYVLTIRDAD